MRRILSALIVALGLASLSGPALGAVCTPTPALPDTERRTEYAGIVAQTGPFNVGFQLYGDSTDYGNWVSVWVNGVALTPVTDFTVTSPSGPLANLCRPISDAQVTFTVAQTGTIEIEGSQRPRRTSQVSENTGVTARTFNQVISTLTAELRERWDRQSRLVRSPPGEVLAPLPPAATRANQFLCWDSTGTAPLACPSTSTTVVTGTSANACGGTRLAKSTVYAVVNADKWNNIALGGSAYYALTFSAATSYDANFSVCVFNEDTTRAKSIVLTGGATFKLWPGQAVIVFNSNNVWKTLGRGRWKTPGGALNMYADFTNGTDTNDCLATGTGACKTVQGALYTLCDQFDFTGTAGGQTQITINLASSTTDTTGVHFSCPLVGAQGGAALTISGGAGSVIAAVGLDAIGVFINATIQVQNVTLSSTTGAAISAGLGARIYIMSGVTFGATPSAPHITAADPGSHVLIDGNYTISGGAPEHYLAQNMASIQCVGPFTATWSANANFSFVFALAGTMGLISCPNMTYTPGAFTATGKRYEADNLSMIYTGGGGANYFPGNAAGTTTSGGTYN